MEYPHVNNLESQTTPVPESDPTPPGEGNPHGGDELPGMTVESRIFALMTALFVTCLVVANLIGSLLFSFTLPGEIPVLLSAGIIPFPITFILTDLLNEFYGQRGARLVTMMGFAMSIVVYVLMVVCQFLPIDARTVMPEAVFDVVANQYSGMFVASLTAYLVGQFLDIVVFHWFRKMTGGRFIWLRATGSTVISQLFDSIIVTAIAFGSTLAFADWLHVATSNYIWKFLIAVGITPFIYLGHGILKPILRKRLAQTQELEEA